MSYRQGDDVYMAVREDGEVIALCRFNLSSQYWILLENGMLHVRDEFNVDILEEPEWSSWEILEVAPVKPFEDFLPTGIRQGLQGWKR